MPGTSSSIYTLNRYTVLTNGREEFMGKCDKKTTFEILDYFYDNGGNFIDTANNYQDEQSEQWLGEWMKKRGNRDQMVIATKFTTCYRNAHGNEETIINTTGNGTKSLRLSLEASLAKLQTSYIDLVYTPLRMLTIRRIEKLTNTALRPLVGLHLLHPRTHAIPQHNGPTRQSSLPRNLRHARLHRLQSQRIRAPKRPPSIFRLPRQVECREP